MYEACFSGSVSLSVYGPASPKIDFRVVETPSNNDDRNTIISSFTGTGGGAKISFFHQANNLAFSIKSPYRVCNIFNWTSAGNKTLRLFSMVSGGNTASMTVGSSSAGQADPSDETANPDILIRKIE